MDKTINKKSNNHSWSTLAEKYNMDVRTLKSNVKSIKKQLDKCVGGRTNYRLLTPKQVDMIKDHMGSWED